MNFSNYANGIKPLLIYRPIGGKMGVDCAAMADGILELENSGSSSLQLRVNSFGGDVKDAFSVFSAIRNSGMEISMYNDFMAASAAGFLMMAVPIERRHMASNGVFMLHDVSGPSPEVCKLLKDSIIDSFVKSTSKDAQVISDMMEKETWMNATEAVDAGFFLAENIFDAVIKSPKLNKNNAMKNSIEVFEYANTLFKNSNNDTDNDMDKLKELEDKIDLQNKEIDRLKGENSTLASAIEAKNNALEIAIKGEATVVVENAIKEGKLIKEKRDEQIAFACKDLSAYKNFISSIPVTASNSYTSASAYAGSGEGNGKGSNHAVAKGREDWTHRDWEKKDPKGLDKMAKENPELKEELYNNCYKS